jgi:hypothetical protein
MTRASNFFFDLMVVAGVAAIRLDYIERYWGVMLILGAAGLIVTYIYNLIVAKTLFPVSSRAIPDDVRHADRHREHWHYSAPRD